MLYVLWILLPSTIFFCLWPKTFLTVCSEKLNHKTFFFLLKKRKFSFVTIELWKRYVWYEKHPLCAFPNEKLFLECLSINFLEEFYLLKWVLDFLLSLCKWGCSHLIPSLSFLFFFSGKTKSAVETKFYWNSYLFKALLHFLQANPNSCWETHYLTLCRFIAPLRFSRHKIFKNNLNAEDNSFLCAIVFQRKQ